MLIFSGPKSFHELMDKSGTGLGALTFTDIHFIV